MISLIPNLYVFIQYAPDTRIWIKFRDIKHLFAVKNDKVTITVDDFDWENQIKWVEVAEDMLSKIMIENFMHIAIETPQDEEKEGDNDLGQKGKDDDWRKTLQAGDIVDAKDSKGKWYESLVKYVYPKSSKKKGKCVIHYIGWSDEYDEMVNISAAKIFKSARLAKRGTHTNMNVFVD